MQFVLRAARPKVQSGLRPVASITVGVHAITQNSRMKKHTAALMGHPALVVTNVLFPRKVQFKGYNCSMKLQKSHDFFHKCKPFFQGELQ